MRQGERGGDAMNFFASARYGELHVPTVHAANEELICGARANSNAISVPELLGSGLDLRSGVGFGLFHPALPAQGGNDLIVIA